MSTSREDVHVTSNVELRNYVRLLLNVELRTYVISSHSVERRVKRPVTPELRPHGVRAASSKNAERHDARSEVS